MPVQYEIVVHGRVQGVGFRYSASREARSLNLKGWVENQADGTVRAVIQGNQEACYRFIRWCRKGPGYSRVEKLDIKEMAAESLKSFSVRY
jgi:acylphosphatase